MAPKLAAGLATWKSTPHDVPAPIAIDGTMDRVQDRCRLVRDVQLPYRRIVERRKSKVGSVNALVAMGWRWNSLSTELRTLSNGFGGYKKPSVDPRCGSDALSGIPRLAEVDSGQ